MVTVNGEVVVDYAYPCMMAERALKNLHNAMLEGRHTDALMHALEAIADSKMTYNAIKDMQKKGVK